LSSGTLGFKAKAAVLFPDTKGKAVVSFVFDDETYSRWPLTIDSLKCEVEIAYGSIEFVQTVTFVLRHDDANATFGLRSPKRIYEAVAARLAEASAAENHACLLDACIGAMDV
jgi:kinetochore protein Spc7/SPC105